MFIARIAPVIFVLLWATGFIGAKLGLPFAEPFTFLALRMVVTLAILTPVLLALGVFWPGFQPAIHSMVTGILVHGIYLGGVFFAISRGMPAGVSALVVAIQPLLTAFIARFMLGEQLRIIQIIGLIAGLVGVLLVLSPNLVGGVSVEGVNSLTLFAVTLAVIGISLGTVYQKRFASGIDVGATTAWQYAGALIPFGIMAFLTETREIEWTGQFIFALAWLVIVLSIGAVGLLMLLIRNRSAASTASLFYLVPGVTAVIAHYLFGEDLQPIQLVGMAIVMAAVGLTTGNRQRQAA
ncbi:MAG: DMT family transporter [Rhizobiaceae bacterium]